MVSGETCRGKSGVPRVVMMAAGQQYDEESGLRITTGTVITIRNQEAHITQVILSDWLGMKTFINIR